jgi:hypothetical protein
MALSKVILPSLDTSSVYGQAAPAVTVYTSGSGTYTVPTNAKYLTVRMIGGGGGGAGAGTGSSAGSGGAGGTSTFGTSLLTAPGAPGGYNGSVSGNGGGAGTAPTISSPAVQIVGLAGTPGSGTMVNATVGYNIGGFGGTSPFGGAGNPSGGGGGGLNAIANTGAGAGGGGNPNNSNYGGGGGSSGSYIEALISSPSSTYSYAVGAGGTAGTIGTNGTTGGTGGSGIIIVTAYF